MVSRQLIIGFAVSLTTAAIFTLLVFYILVLYDKRKKAQSSRTDSEVGKRYGPEGTSVDSHYGREFNRDQHTAFEPLDRPLQRREPTPFTAALSNGVSHMDQSTLTGTGSLIHPIGRPTLAFGAPTRLQDDRPVNYSEGRVNDAYQEEWRNDRSVTPRYHNQGMRISDERNSRDNTILPTSQTNETRSVEGYLNNFIGFSRSFNDSGYSDSVTRPAPLGAGDSSVDDRSSSHSGSFIPDLMNHNKYPVRLHRQQLSTTRDEGLGDSYF